MIPLTGRLLARPGLGALVLLVGLFPAAADGVTITEADYEGRVQFKIETAGATYFYDRAGGGFSRLLDREGKDWITFKQDPRGSRMCNGIRSAP